MQPTAPHWSERPTIPVPPRLELDDEAEAALPLELAVALSNEDTRDAFMQLSSVQQLAYIKWVSDGSDGATRAIRAMMVSRVVRRIG